MPSVSKAQQRFFGVVKGIQKGSGKGRGKAKKAAKDMSPSDVDDFASTKHKGLPNRIKRETKVRSLIRRMVREVMIEEGFAGGLPKEMRKKFDKMRRNQSEVLGYTLTGKDDVKTEVGNVHPDEYKSHFRALKEKKLKELLPKEILQLNELKPPSGKPKVGDYLRDGNTLFAKIIEIRKDEVITNNMSGKWSKNVTKIAFKLKKLKDSGKRNVGRPIWVPK